MKKPTARLGIIAGDFHKELAEAMIAAATAEAQAAGATVVHTIRVAGSYEVPLLADDLLAAKDIDAVIAIGYIERGETMHGEVMGHVVHQGLVDLQLKYRKPIGIAIIGPGATREQAEARKLSSAQGAVRAVLRTLAIRRAL